MSKEQQKSASGNDQDGIATTEPPMADESTLINLIQETELQPGCVTLVASSIPQPDAIPESRRPSATPSKYNVTTSIEPSQGKEWKTGMAKWALSPNGETLVIKTARVPHRTGENTKAAVSEISGPNAGNDSQVSFKSALSKQSSQPPKCPDADEHAQGSNTALAVLENDGNSQTAMLAALGPAADEQPRDSHSASEAPEAGCNTQDARSIPPASSVRQQRTASKSWVDSLATGNPQVGDWLSEIPDAILYPNAQNPESSAATRPDSYWGKKSRRRDDENASCMSIFRLFRRKRSRR
jgi:hypothetical protein